MVASTNPNQSKASDMTAPAEGGQAAVNAVPFAWPSRSLYVGTGANVEAVMKDGSTLMFKNVPSGAILPIQATQITANTTAADVVALF